MLDNTPNPPSKFRTENWVQINDNSHGTYSFNSPIRFKTSKLRSSLCDYSDAYILVKGSITVPDTSAANAVANSAKKVILKNCSPFTKCVSEINNTEINWNKYQSKPKKQTKNDI